MSHAFALSAEVATDVLQFRLHPCAIIKMSSRSPDRMFSCVQILDSGHQSAVLAPPSC